METMNFDTALAESRGEPLVFQLGGREWHCPLPVPAAPLLDLSATAGGIATELEAAKALSDFMLSIVDPTELDDFKAMLRAERVGFDLLQQITEWAMEASTGRPTLNLSDSQAS